MDNQGKNAAGFGGLLFLFAVAGLLFVSLIFSFAINAASVETDSLIYYILNYSVSPLILLAVLVFAKKVTAEPFFHIAAVKKFDVLYLIAALILPFSALFGFGILNDLVENLGRELNLHVPEINLPLNGVKEYVLFIFFICVIPAVFEEFFFRGVLTRCLSNCGVIVAAFFSGLCFALYHLSVFSFVYQFIFGIVLGVLRWKSKSVIPCVIAHFLNNLIILSIEFFGVVINYYAPILIVFGVTVTVGVLLFTFFYKREKIASSTERVKDFLLPYGLIAVITAVAVSVAGAVA